MLPNLITSLSQGQSLTEAEITAAAHQLVDAAVPAETKGAFLIALAQKGETIEEIAGFARHLRAMALQPPLEAETRARVILDVCGAGGDHLGTFNVSTTVALIAAAAGVTMAKHGNRAITSRCGSADVFETLGIPIDLSPEEAARALRDHRFAFLFAIQYHPAFKHIGPARKWCAERGQRTLFNFLGPLLNPARPSAQLIGVPRPDLCEPIARVLQSLGIQRGMVVCGSVTDAAGKTLAMDELSTLGPSRVAEFSPEHPLRTFELSPSDFPIQRASFEDWKGGDRLENAEIIRRILAGQDRGPRRDLVLLNAAAALYVAGLCPTLAAGWTAAALVLDDGHATALLSKLARKA